MQIIQATQELQQAIFALKAQHKSIGFVPTMGALHQGHLSLIMKAKEENDSVVVSVFVNPKQFCEGEDFERYPRTLQADTDICQKAGVDILFVPEIKHFYTHKDPLRILAPALKASVLEGKRRPGHFDGVLEVVLRLFNLTQANRAYFGKKDAQQLIIITQMVHELFLPTEIVPCPIVRDSKGLALSSRNRYLSQEGYAQALALPQSLEKVSREIIKGEYQASKLKEVIQDSLQGLEIDYIAIVDRDLQDITVIKKNASLILLVVRVEGVRLLDNLWI